MVYDGYGSMAELVTLGMQRARQPRWTSYPCDLDVNGVSDEFKKILSQSKPQKSGPTLYFCWPRADLERFRGALDLLFTPCGKAAAAFLLIGRA